MSVRSWLSWPIAILLAASVSAADVDSLVRVLRDETANTNAKGEACVQLMNLGPAAAPAVPALVAQLGSNDELLRDYAISTLAAIGAVAKPALPMLRRVAANDPSVQLRQLAEEAITKIGGTDREISPGSTLSPSGSPDKSTEHPPAPSAGARPALVTHDGRYFRWSAPAGWSEQETTNGVSLLAPDGVTSVSSVILMRSTGSPKPHEFAERMLALDPSIRGRSVLSTKSQPDQPSGMGVPWKVEEVEMRYTVNGIPLRATWTVGITSIYGRFDAFVLGYQAPDTVFETAKLWLAPIARSVTVTNPAQIAGNDQIILPKNNPLDNSGLIESWRQKGLSEDRISKARREGTMGYERAKDSAGNFYNMPLESWDASAGGYRNPRHPEEILQRTAPGE